MAKQEFCIDIKYDDLFLFLRALNERGDFVEYFDFGFTLSSFYVKHVTKGKAQYIVFPQFDGTIKLSVISSSGILFGWNQILYELKRCGYMVFDVTAFEKTTRPSAYFPPI